MAHTHTQWELTHWGWTSKWALAEHGHERIWYIFRHNPQGCLKEKLFYDGRKSCSFNLLILKYTILTCLYVILYLHYSVLVQWCLYMPGTAIPVFSHSPTAFSHTCRLTWPLQLAAHLWSQSVRGNTLAWQDPREKGGEEKVWALRPTGSYFSQPCLTVWCRQYL